MGNTTHIIAFSLLLIGLTICERVKITNVKCISYDESLLRFRSCYLKVIKRGVTAGFGYLENYTRNVTKNVTYNIAFLKKANTYQPFLYNLSGDFCEMLKNFQRNPIYKMIYESLPLANIPKEYFHYCPFNHDFSISNFTLNESFLKRLPIPNGEYLVDMKLGCNKNWKIEVLGYGTLSPEPIRIK